MFLKVENQTREAVNLLHCEMLKRMRVFKLDDMKKVTEGKGTVSLIPGLFYEVRFEHFSIAYWSGFSQLLKPLNSWSLKVFLVVLWTLSYEESLE